jgi:hypothetical protein
MRCDEFSLRFDELLDERREPLDEPNLAAHVAECVECRRTAASIGAAIGALAEMRAASCGAPACELSVERIVAELARGATVSDDRERVGMGRGGADLRPATPAAGPSTSPASPRSTSQSTSSLWRGSAFYALIATAATVVLAAYPVWQWNGFPTTNDPTGHSTGGGNVAAVPPATGDTKPTPAGRDVETETLPSFTELARESRDSYERLARDTQQSFGDALAVASVFSTDSPSTDTPHKESDDWLNQVENGLEPLKRSTLGTLDVLRQVVPADTETRS